MRLGDFIYHVQENFGHTLNVVSHIMPETENAVVRVNAVQYNKFRTFLKNKDINFAERRFYFVSADEQTDVIEENELPDFLDEAELFFVDFYMEF